ncbi:iron-sulfur assembly protein, putative [Plasmodium reichenowi]|uniref:Iron-sulfur assembly protein, putative n=1 Tax=Plasmodium reichenowi TaxID=5854 RepID=A0A151LU65_PLARE|nr:iron-sulfur assembly protein, putative [Plasmodium reichenowi]KYO02718.1 iron-sulfur assembly protein, putative [Plasmodium reichenowi]
MFNNFSNMYMCTLAEKLCKFKKNKFNNIHRNSNLYRYNNLYNITLWKLHFIQTISNNNFNSEIIKKYGDVINKIKFIHTEKRNKQERFMFNNKKYIKRKEYILNDLNEFISIIPNPEINNEISNNSNQKKNEDNKQNILSTNQQIITKYNLNHKENVTSNLNFNNKEEDEKKLDKLLKKRNVKKRDIVTITEEAREELKKIISINKMKNNNNYNDMNNTICNDNHNDMNNTICNDNHNDMNNTICNDNHNDMNNTIYNDKNILKLFFITKGCNGLTHSFNFISKKDIHKEDEIIYDDQNNILLVIDKNCILYVINTTLDYYKDDLTEKFIFKNPNITSICPCGTSFHFSKKKIIK